MAMKAFNKLKSNTFVNLKKKVIKLAHFSILFFSNSTMTVTDSKMTVRIKRFEWCFTDFEWDYGADGELSFWPLEKKKKN
jgi:hypothetical protein